MRRRSLQNVTGKSVNLTKNQQAKNSLGHAFRLLYLLTLSPFSIPVENCDASLGPIPTERKRKRHSFQMGSKEIQFAVQNAAAKKKKIHFRIRIDSV